MNPFEFRNGRLHAEDIGIITLADAVGTPFYCYSTRALEENYRRFARESPAGTLIAYSVKANGNLAVLKALASLGAGADVVSGGELKKALAADIPANRIVFSGVGKTHAEMELGLRAGIHQFNVESEPELEALSQIASGMGAIAPITIRVNPDIDPRTHVKISTGMAETKFGIPWTRARQAYARAASLPGVKVVGVDVHIGSQITEIAPFEQAFARIAELITILRRDGHEIERADLGGGLGVDYRDDQAPELTCYAKAVSRLAADLGASLILEPGRMIAASAGILVSRVIYIKDGERKRFAVIDAGMNDLLRPALYDAHHAIVCAAPRNNATKETYDVVGPICETSDLFGTYCLPRLQAGDLVAIKMAGAYGAAMASAYNARPHAAEIMVKGERWSIVRPRMSDDEFIRLDRIPDWLE
ncbi:MAG TPA: diaminopimelate decarboxylase [Rhizomicrobium sp.]|jgi:diaminopimelate decarboxylase|nr:diaminopimelate decarboxylase [Rhizomicrobium sp.]